MEALPPRKVFSYGVQKPEERYQRGGYSLPDLLFPTLTKTGGMAQVYQGHPFPRKGFPYREGLLVVNKAKRITLALFQPLGFIRHGVKSFVQAFLDNYGRLVDSFFFDATRPPYLKYEYYPEFGKATWDFTYLFLRHLGLSVNASHKTGHILATIFFHDDAYTFPLQDLLTESSQEKLLNNPRQEILRLTELYKQRTKHYHANGDGAGNRFVAMGKMLSYLLLIPAVKRAFKFAVKNVEFKWFQFDLWDRYWALSRNDYLIEGRPLNERMEEQVAMMIDYAQKMNPDKKITRVDNEDGTVSIITHELPRDNNSMAEDNTTT